MLILYLLKILGKMIIAHHKVEFMECTYSISVFNAYIDLLDGTCFSSGQRNVEHVWHGFLVPFFGARFFATHLPWQVSWHKNGLAKSYCWWKNPALVDR